MKSETIKAIFTNLLFVIGVSLIIFGFTRGVLTLAQLIVFPKYPLNSYEETRCEITPLAPELGGKTVAVTKPEEIKAQKEKCLESLEHQRKVKEVEDITASVSTLVAGAVLVFFFKRFILK